MVTRDARPLNLSNFIVLSSLLTASLVALTPVSSSIAAPQYPPTIQAPVIGERILVPVAPQARVQTVVVPKASSDSVPVVMRSGAVPLSQSSLRPNAPLATPTKPIVISPGFILGGVTKSNLQNVPTAQFSAKKSTELQVVSDIPTRITITSLPKSTIASIQVVIGGKTFTLGKLQTDLTGKLILPPLTFTNKGQIATIRVLLGGQVTRFNMRSTI